jgi:hypothetical protein
VDPRLAAVAAAHHGLVTAADAGAAGITRACLRWAASGGSLVRLAPAVWCPADVWAAAGVRERHRLRVRAVQARHPSAAACAESAAVALGLPLPADPPPDPRWLAARDPSRRGGDGCTPSARGRRAWLGEDEVRTTADGIRTTTPARTIVDLARHLSFPWALAAADAARRFHGTTTQQLLDAAARNPCAPGHPAAVLCARYADPKAESPLESVARGVMIQLELPLPRLQVEIGRGYKLYRADLLVDEHWTVVEADGKVKYRDVDPTADERVWNDKRRRDDLHDWGYETVRFVMADAGRPRPWGRRCVRSFERAYERRGLPTPDWGSLTKWL